MSRLPRVDWPTVATTAAYALAIAAFVAIALALGRREVHGVVVGKDFEPSRE